MAGTMIPVAAAGVPTPRHLASNHSTPPHYNVYGHQHHASPYKDKAHLESEDIRHHRWLQPPPEIRTRGELQQARKRGRVPDTTYDFDGDGVIGQLDYFVGRSFDKDADGRLNPSERQQAEHALSNGFLDKYVRGLDSTGDVNRLGYLTQKRGSIIGPDNGAEACNASYQRHFNAHKIPAHSTNTALKLSRKAEMKGYGASVGERWARNCAPVRQPQPKNAQTEPRTCEIAHIRERAEADHHASRSRAGLLPVNMPVNPEREFRTVGLGHEASPLIATRSQLLETRKELMKHDCEELRAKGEEIFPPMSVRRSEKEVREFEFRRPEEGEPRTLSMLKHERKCNRIEYDMANFSNPEVLPREYPRFSDRPDVPFWQSAGADRTNSHAATMNHAIARTVSEPVLKVNDVPWDHEVRELHSTLPPGAHEAGASLNNRPNPTHGQAADSQYGSKTVKRFTRDYFEHGQGRNKPRLFGAIKAIPVGPKDLESLDLTSSMEPIRNAALMAQAEERKKSAVNPRCSRLWAESQSMLDGAFQESQGSRAAQDRTRIPKQPTHEAMRDANKDTLREPRSFSSPNLKSSPQFSVRSGGFQKLDWIPSNTATRPPPRQLRSRDRHTTKGASNSVAPAAPPL